ncbi:MAG: LytTR family transcriptional regulator [Ferruginibacter sp.]|nr:LytTR family transcriptional regulator [Ferruginibacter sp.]
MTTAQSSAQPVKYNDVILFLWLIPLINVINYYLTYTTKSVSWRTFFTYTIDTGMGYIAWLLIRSVILYLDKELHYQPHFAKRLFVQLILTVIACLTPIIVLTELVNWLATDKPVPANFYHTDIFIFIIWVFVINGIYTGIYFYRQWQLVEKEKQQSLLLLEEQTKMRQEENRIRQEGFSVKLGKKDIVLAFNEIQAIYVDGDYTVTCDLNGKKYFMDMSLDKLERSVPTEWFFRINRQYILHRQSIAGFERIENGKLNVLIKPVEILPSSIVISRLRAPAFKEWFQPDKS